MHWVILQLSDRPPTSFPNQNILTTISENDQFSKLLYLSKQLQATASSGDLTEHLLGNIIAQALLALGADGLAFPIHVAFDQHTASPHHSPTGKKLTKSSIVMLDFGARKNGYCSDMTRTFCLSPTPPKQFLEIKKTADSAYSLACDLLKSQGATGAAVDQAARGYIAKSGFSKQFTHATGHGLGLDIHESPSISPHDQKALLANMVVTIEPGIYLEGMFGYRIEDSLMVT